MKQPMPSLLLILLLTGCASLPTPAPPPPAVATTAPMQPEALLDAPAAERIAVLRHPRVTAAYAQLDLSAADLLAAARLPNPALELGWLGAEGGGTQFTLQMSVGLADWLTRNARKRVAEARLEAVRESLAQVLHETALGARAAWHRRVHAAQHLEVLREQQDLAQLQATLAERYHEAGNLDELALQRWRAAAAARTAELALAEAALAQADIALREALAWPVAEPLWPLAPRLPALPADAATSPAAMAIEELEAQALRQRADLRAARRETQAARAAIRQATGERFLHDAEVGVEREREADGARRSGPSLRVELPLFHQRQAEIDAARAQLRAAEAGLAQGELRVRAEVREAWQQRERARDRTVVWQDEALPRHAAAVARIQERLDYMLTDTFSALQVRDEEYAARAAWAAALHDYWQADTALQAAVGGTGAQP